MNLASDNEHEEKPMFLLHFSYMSKSNENLTKYIFGGVHVKHATNFKITVNKIFIL